MNTKDNVYKKLAVYGAQDGDEMPPDYLRRNVMAAIGRIAGQRCVGSKQFTTQAYCDTWLTDELRPAAKATG